MKEQLVCRVCGYVIQKDRLGEICPACGVARTAFQPYQDRIKENRRRLLNLHLHSMVVHFPQALAVLAFGLFFLALLFSPHLEDLLLGTVRVLTVLLPVSIVFSLFSGLVDGQTRFKRLNTPILRLKIVVAALFLAVSSFLALALLFHLKMSPGLFLLLTGLNVLFSVILGNRGGRLTGLEVPN